MNLPANIIDFYMTKVPHAHSDKPDSALAFDLSSAKWEKAKLDKLMKWVSVRHRAKDGSSGITFSIAKDVKQRGSNLIDPENPFEDESPRGIFCIKNSLKASEDNSIKCVLTEAYATCFFRHIRNSIAHGNYEVNGDDNLILFKDQSNGMGASVPTLTALFLTSFDFLNELIGVVESGSEKLKDEVVENAPAYRVNRRVEVDIEANDE